jgi:hypothetical protein
VHLADPSSEALRGRYRLQREPGASGMAVPRANCMVRLVLLPEFVYLRHWTALLRRPSAAAP